MSIASRTLLAIAAVSLAGFAVPAFAQGVATQPWKQVMTVADGDAGRLREHR